MEHGVCCDDAVDNGIEAWKSNGGEEKLSRVWMEDQHQRQLFLSLMLN